MDILAIILACSLYPDDGLVRTLVDIESSGNLYFVGDLATLKTNDSLRSAEAALQFAQDLSHHAGRPAVGLLGVPLAWAARFGRAPIALFDGCTNVAIATAALAGFRQACAARGGARRPRRSRPLASSGLRACVVTRWARALGLSAAPASVLDRLIQASAPSLRQDTDPPPERSAVFLDDSGGPRSPSASPQLDPIFVDPMTFPRP